jgi:ribosomal protein S18 acetylase RimI-like enzyme
MLHKSEIPILEYDDEKTGIINPIENQEFIIDVKNYFDSTELLEILAESVFEPTMERLKSKADNYMSNPLVSIYALNQNGKNIGIIVLKTINSRQIEILNFAVKSDMQKSGVGRKLINYCSRAFKADSIIAETDDDAVGFYKKVGFIVHPLGDKYGVGIDRYLCELRLNN